MSDANFRIRLWNNEPTGLIAHVDLEASHPMTAAALGLQKFRQMGFNVKEDSCIEILPVGTQATQPLPTRDVIDWLQNTEEGRSFNRHREIVQLSQ